MANITGVLVKLKSRFSIKTVIKLIILIAVLVFAYLFLSGKLVKQASVQVPDTPTATVEKRTISKYLSSSGVIEPIHKYDLMTLLQGEVLSATFEEGDQVKKDAILYKIGNKESTAKINTAKTNLTRAQDTYTRAEKNYRDALSGKSDAQKEYQDMKTDLYDFDVKAKSSGIVKKLYIEAGDSIAAGSPIADIYDNTTMLLEVPFQANDAKKSLIGNDASVLLTETEDTLTGTVKSISSITETLEGNQVVKTVTIQVKNPGALAAGTAATANIGEINCSGEGIFKVTEEKTITSDKTGEIASLHLKEGEMVTAGSTVFTISSDSADTQLKTYDKAITAEDKNIDASKNAMKDAKNGIADAEKALDELITNLADYNIKSPISGQIITKNTKEGDTIGMNSANAKPLAVIYDLSELIFRMKIDELDIRSIQVGQKVNVTADALDGQDMIGYVENISLESISTNGITEYPVLVKMKDAGDLLPGMNINGEIKVATAKDALTIPIDALKRGNAVYVKDKETLDSNAVKPKKKESVSMSMQMMQGMNSGSTAEIPDGFHEVAVKVGIANEEYVQILSGLSENDIVYSLGGGAPSDDSGAMMSSFSIAQ